MVSSEDELKILEKLIAQPGHAYIAHGDTHLYILLSEESRTMLVLEGDFKGWNDEQINQYIQTKLSEM